MTARRRAIIRLAHLLGIGTVAAESIIERAEQQVLARLAWEH